MQNHPNIVAEASSEPTAEPSATPRSSSWQVEVTALLSRAADLCVQQGVDVDNFMRGAWAAYVESRPGMREHLEEMQLRDQLEELRRLGRIGAA